MIACNVSCNVEAKSIRKVAVPCKTGPVLHRFANPARAEMTCKKRSAGCLRRIARRWREYYRRNPPAPAKSRGVA